MKKKIIGTAIAALFVPVTLPPGEGFCKKGGIGQGGGWVDGTLYHSHSDRSYSGKGASKGLAKGHDKQDNWQKNKKKKGKGKGKKGDDFSF